LAANTTIASIVDCNAHRFFAPKSMIAEIQKACHETNQEIPISPCRLAAVVYKSLAECYKKTALELEAILGRTFDTINIIGGGANADYLSMLTANATGKTIIAGPVEATAIGNIAAQMLSNGTFDNLPSACECVLKSFDVKRF